MKTNELSKMVKMDNLVPIILGVALSGLGTLMNFAYESIDELHSEVVEHRLLLSRLISPDGAIIQSPTSAASRASLNKEISEIHQAIKVLETKIEYLERREWIARNYKYSNITDNFWFEQSEYPSDREKYNLGIMYLQGLSKENKPMHILAYYWLSLSNDPRAKKNLEYLVSIMTPEQLQKAKKLLAKHKLTKIINRREL